MGYFVTPTAQTSSSGGAVFITDITAQSANDNVGSKNFSEGGFTLNSCVSSTDLIVVSILALTGFSSFKPLVRVQGELVNLTQDEDQNVWLGSIAIDLKGATNIVANHVDGATDTCLIQTDSLPTISTAQFIGDYPSGQTELKEGDTFDFRVESASPFTAIEVDNYGASKSQTESFTATTTKTISLAIADRGNSTVSFGVRVRITNENGTKSDWFDSAGSGSTDKVNTVFLNNSKPSIKLNQIIYPNNQQALKNDEQAQVQHSVGNFDRITYESPNGELSIVNESSYSSEKAVQRIAGTYNIDTANFRVTAYRDANGSSNSQELVVFIANEAAAISFVEPSRRLVSGGNQGTAAQEHALRFTSNQRLSELPLFSVEEGTLQGAAEQGKGTNEYTQIISIHDNDLKGIHQAQLIRAVNLSGIVSDKFIGIAQYEIGGFVLRTLPFTEFTRETPIGTSVVNIEKLVALDKDQIQMTLARDLENLRLGFTITAPSQVYNPTGNTLYWNDEQAINNNTTGFATISLEELP